jgi:hypothetical protein
VLNGILLSKQLLNVFKENKNVYLEALRVWFLMVCKIHTRPFSIFGRNNIGSAVSGSSKGSSL